MPTDTSKSSKEQLIAQINAENQITLVSDKVTFSNLIVDSGGIDNNTKVTMNYSLNTGYKGSVVVSYKRHTLDLFPNVTYTYSNNTVTWTQLVESFNMGNGTNLDDTDLDVIVDVPKARVEGRSVTLIAKATSLAYTGTTTVTLHIPPSYQKTALANIPTACKNFVYGNTSIGFVVFNGLNDANTAVPAITQYYRYVVATNTWTTVTFSSGTLTNATRRAFAFYGDRCFVFGGWLSGAAVNTTREVNVNNGALRITNRTNMPASFADGQASQVRSVSGSADYIVVNNGPAGMLYVFNPANNKWLANRTTGRTLSSKNMVYFYPSAYGLDLATGKIARYTYDSNSWTLLGDACPLTDKVGHLMVNGYSIYLTTTSGTVRFDLKTNLWVMVDVNFKQINGGSFSINDTLHYVAGTVDSVITNTAIKATSSFTTRSAATTTAALPFRTTKPMGGIVNGRVGVFCGDGLDHAAHRMKLTTRTLPDGSWTALQTLSALGVFVNRAYTVTATHIYLIAGINLFTSAVTLGVFKVDPATATVTTLASLPAGTGGGGGTACWDGGNYIYYISATGQFLRYNISANTWTSLATGLVYSLCQNTYDGNLYALKTIASITGRTLVRYNAANNTWIELAHTPTTPVGNSSIQYDNSFYFNTVEGFMEYNIPLDLWSNVATTSIATNALMGYYSDKLYVMGGTSSLAADVTMSFTITKP